MPLRLAASLLNQQLETSIRELEKRRQSAVFCIYSDLDRRLVDVLHKQIKTKQKECILKNKIDLVLHTNGGDPDAAFTLGRLFQQSSKQFTVFVPRKAKSAGTLLACAANNIIMFKTSELGPLDPQIQVSDGKSKTHFSALAVKAAEEKIKKECQEGNKNYAEILAKRMPDAITTVELERTLEISKKYIAELLSQNLDGNKAKDSQIEEISNRLISSYSHHGYVIDYTEAKNKLKLPVSLPKIKEEEMVNEIHELNLKLASLMKIVQTMSQT